MASNHSVLPNKIGRLGSLLSSARWIDVSTNPVLLRLMLPLTAGLIIVSIGFASYMVSQQRRLLRESSRAILSIVSIDLQRSLDEQSRSLAMFENMLVQNAELREALKAKNRQRLLAAYAPLFTGLKSEFGLTHMYFMDPERVCLLRLHDPEKSGDRIERFTAQEAERTGKTASGIELGPLATFTLRVVKPVFENDTLIGYLELGREIEDILAHIQKHPGIELAATINKSALKRESWEYGMKLLGRDHNWDRFANAALIYSSLSQFPAEAEQYVGVPGNVLIDAEAEIRINGASWQIMNTPLRDASGAVVGQLIVLQDISALKADYHRRLALIGGGTLVFMATLLGLLFLLIRRVDVRIRDQEAALRKSEERFSLAMRGARDGLWDWDLSTDRVYYSPRWMSMLGYAPDELEHNIDTWKRLVHPDDREPTLTAVKSLLDGHSDKFEVEFRMLHKDRIYRNILSRAFLADTGSGEHRRLVGTHVDITGMKKTEATLRESEERLNFMVSNSPSVIYTCRPSGDYGATFVSQNVTHQLGYEASEFLADPGFWTAGIHPDDAPRIFAGIATLYTKGSNSQEYRFRHKDGTWHWMHDEMKLILNAAGEPVEILGSWVDITAQKQADERIKNNLKEKELLLREIHHRVKNNMAVISGLLDLQSARIQEDATKELFNESRQRIKSMALVHDKLYNTEDLSRIDFSDYINSIVKDLISSYNKEGREIITKISVGDIMLDIENAIPCGLIINELITNAMKHAFPKRTGGQITVSFTKSCNVYTLFVHDNGIGLPEGFDYTKTNTLGLQLVDALTRQLKGNVIFQSGAAANQGTSVIMTFSEKEGETGS